jgi:KTSC domain
MDDQPQDQSDQTPGIIQGVENVIQPIANAVENTAAARVGDIQMINVGPSSDIMAWGYDPIGFRIQIQFTNQRIYVYENISPMDFEMLSSAPSKGKAFWALIRRNPVGHPFTRIQ